jgi:cytochrome bd-type quinol oxidase subunit 2
LGEIIPVQFLRSLLFLLACLPVLITWRKSRLSLFITLGATLFILVGGILLLQAYWYPPVMRLIHSLEILADSFAHAGALVILLVRKDRREAKAKGESQGRREL